MITITTLLTTVVVAVLVIIAVRPGILQESVGEMPADLLLVGLGSATTVGNLGILPESAIETVAVAVEAEAALIVEGLGIWRGIVAITKDQNVINVARQGILRGSALT